MPSVKLLALTPLIWLAMFLRGTGFLLVTAGNMILSIDPSHHQALNDLETARFNVDHLQQTIEQTEMQKRHAEEREFQAQEERQQAEERRLEAERRLHLAEEQRQKAEEQRQKAEEQRKTAEEQRKTADEQKRKADNMRHAAERQKGEAEKLRGEAERLQREAHAKASEAQKREAEVMERLREKDQALLSTENHKKELEVRLEDLDRRSRERETTWQNERKSMEALLETRRLELNEAQQYVATTDSKSETAVADMLKHINNEIDQTATSMAQELQPGTPGGVQGRVAPDVLGDIRRVLGDQTFSLLIAPEYWGDTILVEIALRVIMIHLVQTVASSWDLSDGRHDEAFRRTYQMLSVGESQGISGRWRALTRKYAKHDDDEQIVERFTNELSLAIQNVCILLGMASAETDRHLAGKRDGLRGIVQSTLEMQKAIGEEVFSRELEVFSVSPSTQFEPTNMVDAFSSGGQKTTTSPPAQVLCTVALGLNRRRRAKDSDIWETSLLAKPSVVLESLKDDLTAVIAENTAQPDIGPQVETIQDGTNVKDVSTQSQPSNVPERRNEAPEQIRTASISERANLKETPQQGRTGSISERARESPSRAGTISEGKKDAQEQAQSNWGSWGISSLKRFGTRRADSVNLGNGAAPKPVRKSTNGSIR